MTHGKLRGAAVDRLVEAATDRAWDRLCAYETTEDDYRLMADDGYEIDRCLQCDAIIWHAKLGDIDCECEGE